MKNPILPLAASIGAIIVGALIITAPQGNKLIEKEQPIPTVIQTVASDPEVTIHGEKLMMPFGKPDLISFCYKGFRMFYGWYDAHNYGANSQSLWGTPDPKCPQE